METKKGRSLIPLGSDRTNLAHPGLTFLGRDPTDVYHYLAVSQSVAEHDPEKKLMLAVLENAMQVFSKNVCATGVERRELAREVEEWVASTDVDAPFSFENICDALGISPNYIRKGLAQWKSQYARQCDITRVPAIRVIRQHGRGRRQTL